MMVTTGIPSAISIASICVHRIGISRIFELHVCGDHTKCKVELYEAQLLLWRPFPRSSLEEEGRV